MNIFSQLKHVTMSKKVFFASFFLVAAVLAVAPRAINQTRAEGCTIYTTPVFNPFPVVFGGTAGTGCTDFPVVAVRPLNSTPSDYSSNLSVNAGDEFYVRIYVHNGAAQGLDPNVTTMQNVTATTNISDNGTSHTINVTLSANNASSISGQASISTASGATLEVESGSGAVYDYTGSQIQSGLTPSGTISLGDQQACFDFSKQILFKVRVVGTQQQAPSSFNLSITPNPICVGSQSNVVISNATSDLNGQQVFWSSTLNGVSTGENLSGYNQFVNNGGWNGQTSVWTSGNVGNWVKTATIGSASQSVSFTVLPSTSPSCGGQQPTASGNITGNVGTVCSSQGLYDGKLNWSTQNVSNAEVDVISPDTGAAQVFSGDLNGNGVDAPWIAPGKSYTFILYNHDLSSGTKTELSRTTLTGGQSCNTPVTGSYNLTVNAQNFCVYSDNSKTNDTPVYTITGDVSLVGQKILWSSTKNGVATGETNYDYGFVLTNNGSQAYWQQAGNQWTTANIGSWTKTANVNGVQKSVSFVVKDCSTVTKPTTLICSASQSSVTLGQSVVFTATGGDTSHAYGWSTANASSAVTSNNAVNYTVTYTVTGNQTATVSSYDGQTANCSVNVVPATQTLTCSPATQNATTNQVVYFTASGGSGAYSFNAPNGINSVQSGNAFHTSYPTTGSQTVTVTSGSQSATCNVIVNPTACVANTGAVLNYSTPVQNGSTYSTNLSWTSSGNNQVKITQINPGSSSEITLTTSGANGSYTVYSLQPGQTYIFKMYDVNCGQQLASVQVTIPTNNPSNLTCTASAASVTLGQQVIFTATGGTGSYSWSTSNYSSANPSATGNSYTVVYNAIGNQTATVTSGSQTAQCNTSVNPPSTQPGIVQISKEVRNVTSGGSFSQIASAKPGDTVEYRITVWPGSSVTLQNVTVTDTIHSGLTYVDGSLTVNGSSHSAGLTSGGLTFATVDSSKLVIVYRYTVPGNAVSGSVQNTATATASNANNTATAQALVTITSVPQGQPGLTIIKQVKNLGPSQTTGFASSINAQQGDTVQYQITVTNSGSADATNVYLSDSNPLSTANVNVSKTYTGTWPNLSLGTLSAGATVTVTYNASITQTSGSVWNTATVSASNAATQNSSALVNISTIVTPPSNNSTSTVYNNCVNNSCNTNTTTTTNNYSYNTTTNTNNYTYNTNTNTYYYYANTTNPVPSNQYLQLGIQKLVRSVNGGTFQKSVTVNNGDMVQFEIDITNTGNQTVNNVTLTDSGVNGLQWVPNTTQISGGSNNSYNNNYNNGYYNNYWNGNNLNLGSLYTGQTVTVRFQAQVTTGAGTSLENVANVYGDNVPSRQDDAWVFVNNNGNVLGGNVNLTYNKKAWNDTKNANATTQPASKEDYITYTLTVTNSGNSPATNFVITDDLSQVLPYADMADNGGGTVNGNVISFPSVTVPAGGSVSASFRVRVKYFLASNLNYVMTNTYGNTVTININAPQVAGAFTAPKTGADTLAFTFSGLMTGAFAIARRRKDLLKMVMDKIA